MDLIPGEIIDRYEVETVLGEGGMARVFRARHTGLGTLHAVKLLTTTTPQVRERLVQEGRVQASLKHPNIVAVHDIIQVDGSPGLVMEYVDGPTLSALLIHESRLSEEQLDALVLPLFDAVEHAHHVHVVHRDLKPANVLLAREGTQLVPKVTDFGLAKLLSMDRNDSATRSGVAMGTPAYMAPEQIRDAKNVGPESDLWSLGAILFELVTGTRAFAGDDVFEIYRCVVEGDRPPVRELAPEAPERMVRAIDAALVVDRYDRAHAVAVLRALWTDGMPSPEQAPWNAADLERIGALGHGGKPWSVTDPGSSGSGPSTGGLSGSEETLVLQEPLPESVLSETAEPPKLTAPAEPPAATAPPTLDGTQPLATRPRPGRWMAVGAVGLLVGLAAVGWGLRPGPTPAGTGPVIAPAPLPTTPPEPQPVAPSAPEPGPAADGPGTTPPEPRPAAEGPGVTSPEPRPAAEGPGVASPEPRPATPRPEPPAPRLPSPPTHPTAPEPQPAPTEPPPAPTEPEAAPAPQPTTAIVVTGYDRVKLLDAAGQPHPPGEVEPGRWKVVAIFGNTPTPSEPFDVAEGQTVTVACSESMGKCQVK